MATRRDTQSGNGRTVLRSGTVVTPDGVIPEGRVVIGGDRIVAVDPGATTAGADRTVDAAGRYVLPGLVDLHGDDVEEHLFPRSGARVDAETALAACERANLAAGITTKFHAIAFEDVDDGDRSVECARELARAVADRDGPVDGRVHARCELTDADAVEAVVELAGESIPDVVSLMSHVPGEGQYGDEAAFQQGYDGNATERMARKREAVPEDRFDRRADRVVAAAREAGATVASHDDATPAEVEAAHDRGVDVSEYPVTLDAAGRAADLGMVTAMGAPNLVRGGSLWGNLSAADAVEAGVLDVLCTDYHPPSLLAAAFVDTGEPLPRRVARASSAPADAVGLDDRGRIEAGARADLVVVDPSPVPTVERAFVAGREVYRVGDAPVPGTDD